MPNDQSPFEKAGNSLGKWLLGTISTITAIISFVNLMRGNLQLGALIFTVLVVVNLLLLLLYVIFYTQPASARSKKRVYPYQKYRGLASAGLVILLIAAAGVLSTRSNRDWIFVAVQGTPTPTASPPPTARPTPTPLPPETTMLVTIQPHEPCLVDSYGIFSDVTRRDTLDIGINNNSNRSLMIASAALKPIWITASQWMGSTTVSATYDVSLDPWWMEARDLEASTIYAFEGSPTATPDALERVARVGFMTWTRPSPLKVTEIVGDKFTIKANAQDRFQLRLGLSETYRFMWGSLALELTMDSGLKLTSDPIEFAVCYEPGIADTSTAAEPAVLHPKTNRTGLTWSAWNDLARQDQGGVVVEVSRIVVAENPRGLDFKSVYDDSPNEETAVEIFFTIQNNTDKPQLILPREMQLKFGLPDIDPFVFVTLGAGQRLDGYIQPGETKVGSLRSFMPAGLVAEIKKVHMDLGCAFNDLAGCSGPGFKFDLDLSTPRQDPLPEELRKVLAH